MKLRKYREGDREYLPDYMKTTFREGDIEKFKPVAEEGLEELKEVVNFNDSDIELVLARTDENEMAEDAPEDYYFMGFSFNDGMRGHEGYAIFLRGSDQVQNWRARFKDMEIHELGHQIFYQKGPDWGENQYYSIRFEGHAENLARIVAERNSRDYAPMWRKEDHIDVEKETLMDDIKRPRTWGDEGDEVSHNLFVAAGDRWQNAEGYTIAYQVVRHLIQEGKVSIESMLDVPQDEWKELVDQTIEEIY